MGPQRNFKPMPRLLVRSTKTPMLFGVAWDQGTPAVLNAIIADVLAYARVVPNTCRLLVVSQDFGFLRPVSSMASVEISSDPDLIKQCDLWKLYYVEEQPPIPDAKHVYYKKVSNFGKNEIRMGQGREGYPSLYNPSDNQTLPPSKSPNINKIPPYYVQQWNPLPAR